MPDADAVDRALGRYPSLELPAIEELLEAMGYANPILSHIPNRDRARLVAIWWESAGDEACYDDGISAGMGHWSPYLAYFDHPKVEAAFLGSSLADKMLTFGDSENFPQNKLVLDRETGKGYCVPSYETEALLRLQWPLPHEYSSDDLAGLSAYLDKATFLRANDLPDLEVLLQKADEQMKRLMEKLEATKGGKK